MPTKLSDQAHADDSQRPMKPTVGRVRKELPMSVIVDDQTIPAEQLGLTTLGQLLNHLQRDNRLVVHVLIDGQEPDLSRLPILRQSPLLGHTLFIETTEPRTMAMDVLLEVE